MACGQRRCGPGTGPRQSRPAPVQAVLDLPVPADRGGGLIGADLVRWQVGDRVDGLGGPPALAAGAGVDRTGLARDLDGLDSAGELHVRTVGSGQLSKRQSDVTQEERHDSQVQRRHPML
jgi:hypothetical protein